MQICLGCPDHLVQSSYDLVFGLYIDIAPEVYVFYFAFLIWRRYCLILYLRSWAIRHNRWGNQNDLALLKHLNARANICLVSRQHLWLWIFSNIFVKLGRKPLHFI